MRVFGRRLWLVETLLAAAMALSQGCSPRHYRLDADREVYYILARKQEKTLGTTMSFSIEAAPETAFEALRRERAAAPGRSPARGTPPEAPAVVTPEGVEKETGLPTVKGAIRLTLRDALELATRFNRDYQSRKEDLYLAALSLTAERFRWRPQWTGALAAAVTNQPGDTFVGGGADFGLSQLLDYGGQVSVNLATDLLAFTTGDPRRSAASLISAQVVQPLWRDAGRLVAREGLTQAERDTVYAIRTFARYQKTLCVDITSRYYRVLQQRDSVVNEWDNYQRILQSRERTEAMAKAGRLPEFQVDQARQDELRARDSWIRALRQYEDQLDQFKITLSLPTDAPIVLDPAEIDRLRQAGLHPVKLTPERAIEIALRDRLDLLTGVDHVADAERKVLVAENGLGPDLDLTLSASLPSASGNRAATFQRHNGTYSAGLDVGLPLQRTLERNAYRTALIRLAQARRAADELGDEIKLAVRGALRSLLETAESYRIQVASVELAQRRVESTNLLLQRGTASARDVLEANAALVGAQNALTGALIDHTLARLALWRDTELLRVSPEGICQEGSDVEN